MNLLIYQIKNLIHQEVQCYLKDLKEILKIIGVYKSDNKEKMKIMEILLVLYLCIL